MEPHTGVGMFPTSPVGTPPRAPPPAEQAACPGAGQAKERMKYGVYFEKEKVAANDMPSAATWWRRGELNSRPKTHPPELLRAQAAVLGYPIFRSEVWAVSRSGLVASLFMAASKL